MVRSLGGFGRRANPGSRRPAGARLLALLPLALALPGCGWIGNIGSAVGSAVSGGPAIEAGQEGFVRGFLGFAASEEPRAALIARGILSAGGSAADAAVAAGFTLSVTMPSRAGLGGGGACLLYHPRRNEVEAILFPPGAREGIPPNADRPAAVPMLARGLFALHVRGGRRPFEELLVPAEQAARLGVEVSRAFATDLAAVAGPLFADPWARAAFARADGQPLGTGERMTQPDLGATLASLRTAGVGDLHQGALARRLEEASVPAGGGLTVPELRASVPRVVPPGQTRQGNDVISVLPGTEGAGGEPLPASTTLAVVDRDGMAVSCAFTMNNLFGTGRIAPGTGVLLAAAPGIGAVRPPALAAAVVHNPNVRAFRATIAGSGQAAAAQVVAGGLPALLRGEPAANALALAPEPGRGVAINCPRYLPGAPDACTAAVDQRGAGLAIGALDR
jgi:gamma-glutamyltranspeptidase/glutathione hydrolase